MQGDYWIVENGSKKAGFAETVFACLSHVALLGSVVNAIDGGGDSGRHPRARFNNPFPSPKLLNSPDLPLIQKLIVDSHNRTGLGASRPRKVRVGCEQEG